MIFDERWDQAWHKYQEATKEFTREYHEAAWPLVDKRKRGAAEEAQLKTLWEKYQSDTQPAWDMFLEEVKQ